VGNSKLKLHNNEEEFRGLVEATAEELGVPAFYIEKDYWVTQCLKLISCDNQLDQYAIFKGGTALSKVYGIIKRFSEDIDFAVTESIRGQTQTQCKNILKKIQDVGRSHPDMSSIKRKDEEVSGNQEFKRFCTYNALFPFPVGDYSQSKEEIIIEVNSFGVPRPYAKQQIMSYIGQFCEREYQQGILDHELDSFELYVITPERAFLDKVIAIQKAFFKYKKNENANEREWFVSKLRHLYDLVKLIEHENVKVYLGDLSQPLHDVIESDAGKCSVAEIRNSDLYNKPDEVLKLFTDDWKRLEAMLYKTETLPSIENVCSVLSTIRSGL